MIPKLAFTLYMSKLDVNHSLLVDAADDERALKIELGLKVEHVKVWIVAKVWETNGCCHSYSGQRVRALLLGASRS